MRKPHSKYQAQNIFPPKEKAHYERMMCGWNESSEGKEREYQNAEISGQKGNN